MTYAATQLDIESPLPQDGVVSFGSDSIQVVPSNFDGSIGTNGFARLNVFIPSSTTNAFGFSTQERGFVEFNIFTDSGVGELRAYDAADALAALYEGQTHGQTSFAKSSITTKGIDAENPQLWRLDIRVPFTRYN